MKGLLCLLNVPILPVEIFLSHSFLDDRVKNFNVFVFITWFGKIIPIENFGLFV